MGGVYSDQPAGAVGEMQRHRTQSPTAYANPRFGILLEGMGVVGWHVGVVRGEWVVGVVMGGWVVGW